MAIAPQVFVRYKEAVLCQFPSALLIVHSEFFYLYDGYRVSDKALVDWIFVFYVFIQFGKMNLAFPWPVFSGESAEIVSGGSCGGFIC